MSDDGTASSERSVLRERITIRSREPPAEGVIRGTAMGAGTGSNRKYTAGAPPPGSTVAAGVATSSVALLPARSTVRTRSR